MQLHQKGFEPTSSPPVREADIIAARSFWAALVILGVLSFFLWQHILSEKGFLYGLVGVALLINPTALIGLAKARYRNGNGNGHAKHHRDV